MKKLLAATLVSVVLFGTLAIFMCSPTESTPPSHRIAGSVVASASSMPLDSAIVKLLKVDSLVAIDTTNSAGTFSFDSVATGSYTLQITKAHYIINKPSASTGDTSIAIQMVSLSTVPGVQLLAPNGGTGVAYKIGDTIKIQYRANPDSVSKVYLEVMFGSASYTLAPCDTCDDLVGFVNGGGLPVTFNWKIPDSLFNSFYGEMRPTPTNANCKVKVENYYLTYVDQSDSSFAINPK